VQANVDFAAQVNNPALNEIDATRQCHGAIEADLKQRAVRHLYLFGLTARGDAGPEAGADLSFDSRMSG
jgi:hypothetical protein